MLWIGLVGALLFVLAAGAFVIAYRSIHPPRYGIRQTPAEFGAAFEEVRFRSTDGTELVGWWVQAEEARAALILCHGMSANREQMLPWAEWLRVAGYSLLMFDFRALGESGGDLCTMGLREPEDVLAAVEFVKSRCDARDLPLGALGFSMGGVAVIIAAARDERIQAFTTLGSYTGLDSAIGERCRRHFGPLGPVVEAPARRLGARWYPGDPRDVDCLAALRAMPPRPTLFANGLRDPIVRPRNATELAAAARPPSRALLLPRSRHDYPHPSDRDAYRSAVLAFFRQNLP